MIYTFKMYINFYIFHISCHENRIFTNLIQSTRGSMNRTAGSKVSEGILGIQMVTILPLKPSIFHKYIAFSLFCNRSQDNLIMQTSFKCTVQMVTILPWKPSILHKYIPFSLFCKRSQDNLIMQVEVKIYTWSLTKHHLCHCSPVRLL